MKWCLAVDIGTTSVKVSVFTPEGELVFSTVEEYPLEFPREEWVEVDTTAYYQALKKGWNRFLNREKLTDAEVAFICTSSQGETLVPVDRSGDPLTKGIVWLDNRAKEESADLLKIVDHQTFYQHTGIPEIGPNWPVTKIMWIRRHYPELYASTYKFMLAEDLIIQQLTGRFVTNKSVVCTSGFFDILHEEWWKEILKDVQLSTELLPELVSPGEVIGPLRSEIARDLSIRGECFVVCGGMDQACGAIGAGNFIEGTISETTGTALAVAATVQHLRFDLDTRIPYYCHSLREKKYLALPYCPTSGIILKWFRDSFFDSPKEYSELIQMAEGIPPGSEGLILLPYFAGSLSPDYNPQAKGIFFGVTLSTQRAHFVRSILEGIAFVLRENIELLESLGIKTDQIISLGGAAKSDTWLQIKADVLQKTILKPNMEESTSFGAFLLGLVALREAPDLPSAYAKLAPQRKAFFPNPQNREVYEVSFQKYRRIYRQCRGIFLLPKEGYEP
ncbi:MAG: FGGY-family carbohydrate kinase [Candidatus Caldatribacteriaceae bacterium]